MAAGTAMTALAYCIDSVPQNLVEYLFALGFDLWLFDWRTSPLLDAHKHPYTLNDVARYDWPAAINEVQRQSGKEKVAVLAHCLSAPAFLLSVLRGYIPREHIVAFVASQVALHLRFTQSGTVKLHLRLDKLLPGNNIIHQEPTATARHISDIAASLVSWLWPVTFSCNNGACYRQAATFGELILHSRIEEATHAIMGDLVPECHTFFLKDVALWGRRGSVLTAEDLRHLDRLRFPIHFLSGSLNRMFVPESTEETYNLLCDANGPEYYRRTVSQGFGHLDCYFGEGARQEIWPVIAEALDPTSEK
ncbi:hypothetical protein [Petrachloros mirabilis]